MKLLLFAISMAVVFAWRVSAQTVSLTPRKPQQKVVTSATQINFRDFFEPAAGELKPSATLLALNGKRVRLVGFMAQMENAPRGAFYLCPRPVFCDEGGGGTADLPAETVRVIVRSAKNREISFIPSALEITGRLQVGNQLEDDGQVSLIRLILDGPQDLPQPHGSTSNASKHRRNLKHLPSPQKNKE